MSTVPVQNRLSPAKTLSPERDLLNQAGLIMALVPALLLAGLTSTFTELPRSFIVSELASDRYRYQWVTGSTMAGMISGMSIVGWLAGHFGLRRCYLAGLVLYIVGSYGCASSNSADTLALVRFVQSWGNGMIVTTVLALLWRDFPIHPDLSIAIYVFGLYFGRIAGPVISAWLVNYDSWRTIFYLKAAVAIPTLYFALHTLRRDEPAREPPGRFDFPGFLLLAGWITCLLIGLYRFQLWGWSRSNQTLAIEFTGILLFAAFLSRQFTARNPLLHLRLFRIHHFTMGVVIKALADAQFFAVLSIITRYMVITREYPRFTTGYVYAPAVLAMTITLAANAHWGRRSNRKLRLLIGLAGMSVATLLISDIDLFTDKQRLGLILAVWAGSVGLVASPLICISQDGLAPSEIAASASIKNLFLVLPGAIGGGLIGILTERQGDANFDVLRQTVQPNRIPFGDVSLQLADWIVQNHGSDPATAATQASQVIGRYIKSNASVYADQIALIWLAGLAALAFLIALTVRSLPDDAPGPKRG